MNRPIHLLDLMELPSQQRRLIQLLLRNGTMLEDDLRHALRVLPEGNRLTESDFLAMLTLLENAGWLIKDTQEGEHRYRVLLSHNAQEKQDAIWERLKLDDLRQQWQLKLHLLRLNTTPNQRRPSALFDSPTNIDPLLRRGGKRALPQSIWDKLDDKPNEPGEKPSTRKSLWDALGSDSE